MDSGIRILVPGGLNTDLVGLGIERLLLPGQLTLGGTFHVGPGGKARNMAQMAAAWLGRDKVAMIGKTVSDPFGLWKVPYEALRDAGVNVEAIEVVDFEESGGRFPGIALIPVDRQGQNQIYVLPGINEDFSPDDILAHEQRFAACKAPAFMMIAMEIPLQTVVTSIRMANRYHIRVVLDPGGLAGRELAEAMIDEIPWNGVMVFKPNEHEIRMLTGIEVKDQSTAARAAGRIIEKGCTYVMITLGAKGAYLFGQGLSSHIPVPQVKDTGIHDETGCGDQVCATLTACLCEGMCVVDAARKAVWAGTVQFGRKGVIPVGR